MMLMWYQPTMQQIRRRPVTGVSLTSLLLSVFLLTAGSGSARAGEASLHCDAVAQRGARTTYRACRDAAQGRIRNLDARELLRGHAQQLGLASDAEDLQAVEIKQGLSGRITRLQQTFRDLPVFDAYLTLSQEHDGALRSLHTSYRSRPWSRDGGTPTLSGRRAVATARSILGVSELRSQPDARLVWRPGRAGAMRLAWQVLLPARVPLGDFLVLVDARTGRALLKRNLLVFDAGSGLVHLPNPVQTSGNTLLTDAGDGSYPAVDAERSSVKLQGLDSGTGFLRGEFVDLVSLPGGLSFPDAHDPNRSYEYDRSDPRFEQVVVYHAIDSVQRYFHELGFDSDVGVPNGIRDFPTRAHAHWYTEDQSFYSPLDDALRFGDGGVDDAEDADIVIHEYGHAVQFDQNTCWSSTGEMGAMGEGFGDYLAASFYAGQGDPNHQALHAACVGDWDATFYSGDDPPCLRRVDGDRLYPADLVGEIHDDGEIWSRALWDLRAALGGLTVDPLVLEHHFSLACDATMPDAAREILDVDLALNGGANELGIRAAFCTRGILQGDECVAAPALRLEKSASPSPVGPGGLLSYTLSAVNDTDQLLSGVVIADQVPPNTSYLADSASDGGAEAAGVVSWPVIQLAPDESVVRSFQVVLDPEVSGGSTLFLDDMESGGSGWTVSHGQGSSDWTLDPNHPHGGSAAWLALDVEAVSDQYLSLSTPISLPSSTELSFWHDFTTEAGFDGGVVEISADGGAWRDLGSAFTQGGYPGIIAADSDSPIGGRWAFTGDSAGYAMSVVDLGGYAGQSVQIRFRMATDGSVGAPGWFIDDVEITQRTRIENLASVIATQGDSATASESTPVVGSPALCGDGILQPGNDESCDDGNTLEGDGCRGCQIALLGEPVCGAANELCSSFRLLGTAAGGQILLTVEDVELSQPTSLGQGAEEVASRLAQAINDDAILSGLGVLAQAVGGLVITTGEISSLEVVDAGLRLAGLPIPLLPHWAMLLLGFGLLGRLLRSV